MCRSLFWAHFSSLPEIRSRHSETMGMQLVFLRSGSESETKISESRLPRKGFGKHQQGRAGPGSGWSPSKTAPLASRPAVSGRRGERKSNATASEASSLKQRDTAVVVKTNGIPFWLVGEFTTHFRTYFSGWIGMFTGGAGF